MFRSSTAGPDLGAPRPTRVGLVARLYLSDWIPAPTVIADVKFSQHVRIAIVTSSGTEISPIDL